MSRLLVPTRRQEDEEATLVAIAKTGNREALGELLARHLPALHRFVRRHADRRVLAQESSADIVQSICQDVVQNLHRFEFRGERSFRSWLCSWALNRILNLSRYHRSQRRSLARSVCSADPDIDVLSSAVSCTPCDQASLKERLANVEAALHRLPEHYRAIILRCRVEGTPHAQLAKRMGVSEVAVRSLLRRAIVSLEDELGEHENRLRA
jgi:RNA polymerase sigma-70 factor (ECF subfamily)